VSRSTSLDVTPGTVDEFVDPLACVCRIPAGMRPDERPQWVNVAIGSCGTHVVSHEFTQQVRYTAGLGFAARLEIIILRALKEDLGAM
jgi:hypothetical protein